MRDWSAFVRARLRLHDLAPEREARIIREVAVQLEDFYRDAIAQGADDATADLAAAAHVADWTRLADDVQRADWPHARPGVDRLVNAIEVRVSNTGSLQGGLLMLAHMLRDVRYGIRQLIKAPAFTVVAVLALALGIGATTTIFSVVNGVLLRPLPYPASEQLVRVNEVLPQYGLFSVAPANFFDWRQQNTVFEHIAAYSSSNATLVGADGPDRVAGALVSWDVFDLLRVAPQFGSGFRADQDAPGAAGVIIISHGMWQQRLGGDPGVVGRSITLSGAPVTIVGVMPAEFYFPTRTVEFWRPIAIDPVNATRGGHFLGVIARLKPAVTLERADAEMKGLAERLAQQYPAASANESAKVVLLQEQIVGAIRPALMTLFAAVGLVVLIACANVANLLLVRASVREKEIAIRAALGADRRRLFVQMLAESLVLATAGGALGVGLAYLALAPILTLSGTSIPRVGDVGIDTHVLFFAALASIATGLLFGIAPAWRVSRTSVGGVLKEGGRSSATSGGRWMRSSLLVAEVALSIVLLTGAALLLRSFDRLTNVDPGFKADHAFAFQVSLPPKTYGPPQKTLGFYDALTSKLEATPGIESAAFVQTLPMRGSYVLTFNIRGRAPNKPGEDPSANYRAIGPHYFDALGVALVRGRAIAGADSATAEHVALVDEAFAKKYFPGEDPIGQGIQIGNGVTAFYDVVGVVGNVHAAGLDETADPTMYAPITQDVFSNTWVVARAKGDPAALSASVRQAMRSIDPALPMYSMNSMTTIVSDSVAARRFSMLLIGLFAVVALFLAAIGLYGVVAYSVSQRTREIGLRMAIGAQPSDVLKMIVGDGMKLALIGVAVGIPAALIGARLTRTLLFDVAPSDPLSYAVTAAVLLVVAALACYVPARRAMRVDPLAALQGD